MALVQTDIGRVVVATAVRAQAMYLGVGSGLAAWDAAPTAPAAADVGLVTPIAIVRPSQYAYVTQDNAAGTIAMPDGSKWAMSATPTRFLFLSAMLGFTDGPTETLREAGLFLGSTFAADVTAGQTYIPWAKVTNAGSMLAVQRFAPIQRAGTQETFNRIISF